MALLQSPSTKIRTLSDLLHSRLKFGVDDTVFNRYYFAHQTEATRKLIYEQKVLRKDGSMALMPLEEGVEHLRDGLFAFHMELGVGYKIVSETFFEHEKCDLKELQFYELIDPWYAIQKNSSLKELVKIGLFRLREHGIQERENGLLYTKKPVCHGNGGNFVTVGIVDIKPALLVLCWGFLVTVLVLALEISVKRRRFTIRCWCCKSKHG